MAQVAEDAAAAGFVQSTEQRWLELHQRCRNFSIERD
jgi:hypothetical protein